MKLFALFILLASANSPLAPADAAGLATAPESSTPAEKTPLAKSPDAAPATKAGDPYSLSTCPISGGKLGSMGIPIVKSYGGREVRFCCKSCPPKFEKNLDASMAKLDEAMIADQLPLYPTDTSIVSGKKLPEKPVDWIYNNRLIRLTGESEKTEFQKDPARYLAVLDKATLEKQVQDYPLKTCPVTKDGLDAMGGVKDIVIGGRLIRVCCEPCVQAVRNDPSKFVSLVDGARKEQGH